jgi:hypothetical protein
MLRGLLLGVLAVSAGLAAVSAGKPLVLVLVCHLNLWLLLATVVGSLIHRGNARTFWIACLVFLAVYDGAAFSSRSLLVTDSVLSLLTPVQRTPGPNDRVVYRRGDVWSRRGMVLDYRDGTYFVWWGMRWERVAAQELTVNDEVRAATAHAVLGMAIALLAAWICRWLFGGPGPAAAAHAADSPPQGS